MKKISIQISHYLLENNSSPMAITLYIHVQVTLFHGQMIIKKIYKRVVIQPKKKNADLFVSIHVNSSEYEANGYEIYCDFNNKNTVKLSNSILKQLDQLDYSTNRGLLDTNETPLYIVKNNKVDAILIEAGFISDDSDLYYLKNHTDNIATAIAVGIKKSLNE